METKDFYYKQSLKKKEEYRLEIRKQSVLISFNEKRKKHLENKELNNILLDTNDNEIFNTISNIFTTSNEISILIKNLFAFIENIKNNKDADKYYYYSIKKLKIYFLSDCKNNNIFINELYINKADLVLSKFLNEEFDKNPDLQKETLLTIGNMFSQPHIEHLNLQKKCFANLLRLIKFNKNQEVLSEVLFCLTNCVCDSSEFKISILKTNIDEFIWNFYNNNKNEIKYIKTSIWFIANVYRYNPFPPNSEFQLKLLPMVNEILTNYSDKDEDILHSCLICFRSISDGDNNKIQKLMLLNHTELFLKCIIHQNMSISYFALSIICNITSGEDSHIEVLDYFENILINKNICKLQKVIGWGISNILAAKSSIIDLVLNHSIFNQIIDYTKYDIEIVYEFILGLSNATEHATKEQIIFLLEKKILDAFNFGLKQIENIELQDSILDGIVNILKIFPEEKTKNLIKKMEEIEINKSLENLLTLPNKSLYSKVSNIISKYFENE